MNIEPQGYYESFLPARMLRYRSDVWEYTMSTGRGIPFVPKDIRDGLSTINNEEVLNELIKNTIRVESLDQFKELLEQVSG